MFCVAVVMGMPISNHTGKVTFPSYISEAKYAVAIKIARCNSSRCSVELDESLMSGWGTQRDTLRRLLCIVSLQDSTFTYCISYVVMNSSK